MIYLDTCALTKLLRPEPQTPALHRLLTEARTGPDRAPWVASVLVEIELIRVVRRTMPEGLPAALLLLGALDIMPLDPAVVSRAQQLTDPGLRSLDAVHLATALEIGEITAFVTYDRRLLKVAEEHGLRAVAPA